MVLRADGAIRADHLHSAIMQESPGIFRPGATEGVTFLGVRHLRHDGELRERTNRFDSRQKLGGISKSFQDEKIHAAFFERLGLLPEYFPEMLRRRLAFIAEDAERPDRSGDQDFVPGGLSRLSGDFDAA